MKKKAYLRGLSAAALLAALAFCMAVFTGCGRDDSEQQHFYMMEVQTQEYPRIEDRKFWNNAGQQFYKDEAVRFWSESETADGRIIVNIYLSHDDGSSELLLKGMPENYRGGRWWLDQSGSLYYLQSKEELEKLDEDGSILFRQHIPIWDICQMPDSRIMMLLSYDNNTLKIAELDPQTGSIAEKDIELKGTWNDCIGSDAEGLVLLNEEGFWRVDLKEGSLTPLMNFSLLSYQLEETVYDFRLPEEGRAELLKQDISENLQMVDISKTRKLVVFRDSYLDSSMKTLAYQFNHSNEEYYVVLEECGENTSIQDFRSQTGIALAVGKGADIIVSDAMPDVMGYIQNGALEDLTPYIEESGIGEEDYFPATFSHWAYEGKIYGVDLSIQPDAIWIDEEILGGRDIPDIETLVSAMLDYKGEKKWYWPSDWILKYLLQGSEDMWGLIDWKEGECSFTGDLFAKMLKAAKMHGGSFAEENISAGWAASGFGFFDSSERMADEGRVYAGFLFDDGTHALANAYSTLAVSSRSQNKKGAWEFISFLLDKEIQLEGLDIYSYWYMVEGSSFPVSREAFNELGVFLERMTAADHHYDDEVKQDIIDPKRHEEVRAVLEDARFAPIRTAPILDIILDEADWYFDNAKSLEEVCAIIQNRVKLYLQERT